MSIQALRFEPDAWYTEHQLTEWGAFTDRALKHARDAGELRFAEKERGRRIYKGEWLTAWLEGRQVSA